MTYEDFIPLFDRQIEGTLIPTNIVTNKGAVFFLKESVKNLQKIYKEEVLVSYKLSFFELVKDDKKVDVCILSFFFNQEFLYFIPYNIHNEKELLLLNLFLVADYYEIMLHNPEVFFKLENLEKESFQAIETEEENDEIYNELLSTLFKMSTKEELFSYLMLINSELVPSTINLNVLEKKESYNI